MGAAGRFGGPGGDLLFHALRRSTIGAEGFHGRVRDGIGCFAPRYGHQAGKAARGGEGAPDGDKRVVMRCVSSWRNAARRFRSPISAFLITDRGNLSFGAGPKRDIERLVPVSCTGCPASTSGLSTWWSTTALSETWF